MPAPADFETPLSSPPPAEQRPAAQERPLNARPAKKHLLRNLMIVGLVLALGAAAYLRISATRKEAAEKAAGPQRGGQPVPVIAGTAQAKDVPIYLDGLGTIQALNTVTVRARVDGQLEKLAFTEGDEVKEGDLLAQLDPAPLQAALEQAQARQRTDEVQLNNARADLERFQDLIQKKVISQQQFDTQKALTAQLEATVRNDQAAVTSAQVQLDYARIVSPISGRTGIRQVDAGNLVRANDTTGIVTITQLRPISLIFTLPEQSLVEIHKQQAGGSDLAVTAVARDHTTVLGQGKLTVIDNQIDTATGTIRLKAEFPNEKNELWPGQFINARLLLTTQKGGVVVPASVIQRGPEGSFAYIIKEDQSVEMRPVQVTQVEAGEALIADGLAAGEKIVVDGQYKLQPGAKVKIADRPPRAGGAQPGGPVNPQPGAPMAGPAK